MILKSVISNFGDLLNGVDIQSVNDINDFFNSNFSSFQNNYIIKFNEYKEADKIIDKKIEFVGGSFIIYTLFESTNSCLSFMFENIFNEYKNELLSHNISLNHITDDSEEFKIEIFGE